MSKQQQYVPNVGGEPGPEARRDAIHVPVAPLRAAEPLEPGQHVSLDTNGNAVAGGEAIGVVDPFRTASVRTGESFWLFVFPGTVTSLRHLWSHPAFGAALQPKLGSVEYHFRGIEERNVAHER